MSDDASEEHDDLVAAGLYDPSADDAAERLALLTYLTDEIGASIPELVQAEEVGGLLSFAAVRSLRTERRASGPSPTWPRGSGSISTSRPRYGGRRGSPTLARSNAGSRRAMSRCSSSSAISPRSSGRDQSLQLLRTTGEAIGRIAEAEVALLRSNIEAPLAAQGQFVDVARGYAVAARQLFPRITAVIDVFHRRQIELIGRRYSDVNAPTSSANVVELAVGFADIAGYTGLSHRLDPSELAAMLARFEATTGDVIAAAGANVAKRIGDAVMFVTNAPGVACALALELIEACTQSDCRSCGSGCRSAR